jgi:hypothetical protein
MAEDKQAEDGGAKGILPQIKAVRWNDANMTTSFVNVVNVLNTREEFMLLLGTNQTWNAAESDEVVVQLNSRVVMTPYAAKRLMLLLQNRLAEYEGRFGELTL